MRCLAAVALLFSVALHAGAQRGGGRGGVAGHAGGGGFHGAASAHFGGGVRGGFAGSVRPGLVSGPRFGARVARPPAFAGNRYPGTRATYPGRISSARPVFYSRSRAGAGAAGRGREREHDRRFERGYGGGYLPYGYTSGVFFDPFLTSYFDSPDWFDEGEAQAGDAGPYAGDAEGYAAPLPPEAGPEEDAGPVGPGPAMWQAPVRGAAAPLEEEDAVTIVFKDGRPPEQIRNYALTRTTLLVSGRRIREIPLSEVDVPATEKVNRAAGVEFQLPEAR